MRYSINYIANKESQDDQVTKLNNQFLSVVDLYSLDPTNLEIQLSSANFGEGNYPDLAKHRWIIRTHEGYFLKLNFKVVKIEDDVDTIEVYKFETNGDKKIVDEINVAKQLVVNSNQLIIVFISDCTVNKRGFQATVQSIKSDNEIENKTPVATTPEMPTTQNTTPEIPTTQNTTPEKATTKNTTPEKATIQNTTPEIPTTQNTTPEMPITQNTTPEKATTKNTTAEKATAQNTTPEISTTQNTTPEKATTQNTTPEISTTQKTTPEKATTQNTTPEIASTQNTTQKEYRYKIVLEKLNWNEARQHCFDQYHGNLIQYDNRILTLEGRRELQESLGIEVEGYYHTGIVRDPDDITIWRRIDWRLVDDQECLPDGWIDGFPLADPSRIYMQWRISIGDTNHNKILNYWDDENPSICEFNIF